MELRKYKGQEPLSLLGFGAMRLPRLNDQTQEIDKEKAFEMIDYAMAHGVNYYDTSYVYHAGLSEPFLGEALSRYPRESYHIATKLPPWPPVSTEDDIKRIFDEQLARFKTDYFDFYLIHNYSSNTRKNIEKLHFYDFLREKKEQGYIKRLGFSMHDTPEMLAEIADKHEWDFAQIQLNYLDWDMQKAKEQYEVLTSRGLPVTVMEPIRGGGLVNLCPESIKILHDCNPDASAASWALRFVASLPNVLVVLSGMSTLDQVKDNINTMTNFKPLSDEERAVLEKAVAAYRKTGSIPCTSCGYCMPCPAGVDIPRTFALYNAHCAKKSAWDFVQEYRALGDEHQAHRCIRCGKCMTHCPQNIKIPDQMHSIAEFAAEMMRTTPDRPFADAVKIK